MELLTQPEHDAKYWTTVGNIPSSHAMWWNDTQRLDPLHREIFEVMVISDELRLCSDISSIWTRNKRCEVMSTLTK